MELEECKRKAVSMLSKYNDNLVQIKMLEAELEELETYTSDNMAVCYDKPSGGKTNKVISTVENGVIQRQEEREQLLNKLRLLRKWQRKMDIALDSMSPEKKILLRMRFIEGRYWKVVCQYMNYSEEYIRKELKEAALEAFTRYLFPESSKILILAEQL